MELSPPLDPLKVQSMIEACKTGNMSVIYQLLQENPLYARQQDQNDGMSPLMAASAYGHLALCEHLLQQGAPWNAIDRQGKCAGNYAIEQQHWSVVNMLVEWGVRAELILGQLERTTNGNNRINESTKPEYLQQKLTYRDNALLDSDQDAVMMEWERPLMQAHANIIQGKRVLNVGFGMGIIDAALQELQPEMHIIIEAHPDVQQRMLQEGWDKKPNVRLCMEPWQSALPKLLQEHVQVDGIFFDTYGEHFMDMQDFHSQMVHLLAKPHGVYSFFNGLAPDNIFFHGVACECVKLQLAQLGLDAEFLSCEIQVDENQWEGVRRKYWHNNTYYLPRCTWNPQFLQQGKAASIPLESSERTKNKIFCEDDTIKKQKI